MVIRSIIAPAWLYSEGRQGADTDNVSGNAENGENPEGCSDNSGVAIDGENGSTVGSGCDTSGVVGCDYGSDQEEDGENGGVCHDFESFRFQSKFWAKNRACRRLRRFQKL